MEWLDEIDLNTSGPPVSMGVRKLGDQPWLFEDEEAQEQLALKAALTRDPLKEVFLSHPDTDEASNNVISLIRKEGIKLAPSNDYHPLERAGLSIQEDLCLLHRTKGFWRLEAASLCFPSRWELGEKIGKDMSHIHGPVVGYEEHLSKKVNNFFDRLGNEPVWRRNWFIHPDNSLYQPNRPEGGDPIIQSADVGEELFVRSERQTLRSLGLPGWILFTIRVQRTPLNNLFLKRKEEFQEWIFEAPDSHHDHKGLVSKQVEEIQKKLVN